MNRSPLAPLGTLAQVARLSVPNAVGCDVRAARGRLVGPADGEGGPGSCQR